MTSGRGFSNWRQWLCVSNSIIFTIKLRPIDKSICRNIVDSYQIWNSPLAYLWGKSYFWKLSLVVSTDVCMGVFSNSLSKKFGKYAVKFHFLKIAQLQSTSYYQTKNSSTDTFELQYRYFCESDQKEKNVLK